MTGLQMAAWAVSCIAWELRFWSGDLPATPAPLTGQPVAEQVTKRTRKASPATLKRRLQRGPGRSTADLSAGFLARMRDGAR